MIPFLLSRKEMFIEEVHSMDVEIEQESSEIYELFSPYVIVVSIFMSSSVIRLKCLQRPITS